jgi:hypothetical protein
MAKLIFRPHTDLQWRQLKREDLTIEEMRDRLNTYPFVDCGFMGEMMEQLYGGPHVIVELWDTEFVSIINDVLTLRVNWTHFHNRENERRGFLIVMEGEL